MVKKCANISTQQFEDLNGKLGLLNLHLPCCLSWIHSYSYSNAKRFFISILHEWFRSSMLSLVRRLKYRTKLRMRDRDEKMQGEEHKFTKLNPSECKTCIKSIYYIYKIMSLDTKPFKNCGVYTRPFNLLRFWRVRFKKHFLNFRQTVPQNQVRLLGLVQLEGYLNYFMMFLI